MADVLFVEYPKCSTCRRAKAWLDAHGICYTDRHIVEDNPTADELASWQARSGLPVRRFFNTSGMKYRELGIKATDSIALTLLDHIDFTLKRVAKGQFIKSPLYWDVKRFYPKHLAVGREALHLIHAQTGVELPDDEEVNKLLYIGGPLIEVSQALVPEFQTVANTVGLPPDMMGEVMLAGITKATGMDIVMEHYGLDIAESVAIGDGANDIEMVEHAGLGIAMGNASSDLLAVADYITDDVEADGLRKAVEHAISRSSRSRT